MAEPTITNVSRPGEVPAPGDTVRYTYPNGNYVEKVYHGEPPPPANVESDSILPSILWNRLTDTEQDTIIAAEGSGNAAAKRFMAILPINGVIKKDRVRPIIEGVWGTPRADELLADPTPEERT